MLSVENNPSDPISKDDIQSTPTKQFSFEILKLIKNAQQQHGLRHGDYQRYRGYCSRRIRRLRKVLRLPQGDRRHFKRRDVLDAHIMHATRADERYLHVPLVLAERCWAYAMQLRQESNTEPRKKFHLVQKLRKAAVYALQLEELCKQDCCDFRTKLESQAYVAWIQGTLQFELQLWLKASENLKKAQVIYEKLASTLSDDDELQLPYRQRVDDIAPSLRYCAYNIGGGDGEQQEQLDLLELRSQGVILENINALLLAQQNNKEKAAAEVLYEVQWFDGDVKIPVTIERVRLFLLSIDGLDESLRNATNDNQAKIKILENLFIDLRDVIALVREKLNTAASGKTSDQNLLLAYLLSIRVERTSQRNLLLLQQSRKVQDCIRLLDIIIQQTNELSQNDCIKTLERAQIHYGKQLEAYKILRIYYLANLQGLQRRWKAAAVLYDQAINTLSKQQLMIKETQQLFNPELIKLLANIELNGTIDTVIAQANFVFDDVNNEINDGLNDFVLPQQQQKTYKNKKPLCERLDEFREEPQLLTRTPNIVGCLPPAMEPVPAKPLFYDLALNFIELPSLQDKLLEGGGGAGGLGQQKRAGISDFVKGLWGWGGKK